MAETASPVKAKAQDNILATIDELRQRLNELVGEAFGQEPAGDRPPEQAAAENIDNLIKNAPPGLLIEELKRMAQDPDIVEMTRPNDADAPEAMQK